MEALEQKYGKLTILADLGMRKCGRQNYHYLRAHCDCGSEFDVPATRVYSGHVKSCGCARKEIGHNLALRFNPPVDIPVGEKFGKLTILNDAGIKNYCGNSTRHANAKCDCGNLVCKPVYLIKTGKVQSCGCLLQEHASSIGLARRLPVGKASFNALYGTYQKRAKKRGHDFNLSVEQFQLLTSGNCAYCGSPPHMYHRASHYFGGYVYNGIDRVNSDAGYTKENTVSCCEICNRAKSDMSAEDFSQWLERVRRQQVPRPVGDVTLDKITDSFGKDIPLSLAFKYGWLVAPSGDACAADSPFNLFLDQGRQCVAYCLGFRSPIQNYTIQNFGVGTGTTAAQVTDVALEAPIVLSNSLTTKAVDTIDFLSPFVLRIGFTLGVDDANGYIISEQGLFSGNDALIARKVRSVSINKTSDFASTMTWRLRF